MKQKVFNLIVLDASGSMYSIRNEAVAGVVETVQTIRTAQEKNPELEQVLTLVVFNTDQIKTVYDRMPIADVPDFIANDYVTTACTPLYDAVGNAITHLRQFLADDDAVLVTIITDGYENASREWNREKVFALIKELEKKDWLFTYIGANQDAYEVGRSIGISKCMDYDATPKGMKAMFQRECSSRQRLFSKLGGGMSFSVAKEDPYFVDEPKKKGKKSGKK